MRCWLSVFTGESIMGEIEERRSSWNKALPIGLIVAILLQTFSAFYWMGNITAKLDAIEQRMLKMEQKMEKQVDAEYRGIDAKRDFLRIQNQINIHETRLDKLERGK